MPSRMNWTTAACGERVVPVLLISGTPYVYTPAGCEFATVAWTATPDAAWWPVLAPVTPKGWLSLAGGLSISSHARPAAGEVDIRSVRVTLQDKSLAATVLFRSKYALSNTPLTASLAAGAGTMNVESTAAFPANGTVYLEREAIDYSGKTATSFTGLTRGRYGTKNRLHTFSPLGYSPSVCSGINSAFGRRATLWMVRVSGTTGYDPTLIFDGRVGSGWSLEDNGASLSFTLDHVVKVLGDKARPVHVMVSGWQVYAPPGTRASPCAAEVPSGREREPLHVRWNGSDLCLVTTDATDGWWPTTDAFRAAFNNMLAGTGYSLSIAPGNKWRFQGGAGGATQGLYFASWAAPVYTWDADPVTNADHTFDPTPPEACVHLYGTVHLSAADIAALPAVPTPSPYVHFLQWTLRASDDVVSGIQTIGASTVTLGSLTSAGGYLLTEPTPCALGLRVQCDNWFQGIRYGVLAALEELQGLDFIDDAIDWERSAIAIRQHRSATANESREYMIDLDTTTVLDLLRNEATWHGLALVPYHGRVAFASIHDVSSVEQRAATIAIGDLLRDTRPEVEESRDGLFSTFAATDPKGRRFQAVDDGSVSEYGEGSTVECTVPQGAFPTRETVGRIVDYIMLTGLQVLGPWRAPYDTVSVQAPLRFGNVQVGDVVVLSDWLTPTDEGTRGLTGRACLVVGRDLVLYEQSKGHVVFELRPGPPWLTGYAPSALVKTIAGTHVQLDTATLGGACFAEDLMPDGTTRADAGASTFVAGDKVSLIELDSTMPAVPWTGEVAYTSGSTVELTGTPGLAWEALAASGLVKVALVYQDWAGATRAASGSTPAQRDYCFQGDRTTLQIAATADIRRFGY